MKNSNSFLFLALCLALLAVLYWMFQTESTAGQGLVQEEVPRSGVERESEVLLGTAPLPRLPHSALEEQANPLATTLTKFAVSGVVTDPSGFAIPGATVTVCLEGEDWHAGVPSAVTDGNGRFLVDEIIESGRSKVLMASATDYAPTTLFGLRHTTDVQVVLTRKSKTVLGRVLREDGSPCPDAQVILWSSGLSGRNMLEQIRSGEDGSYRFARVAPGRFYVAAAKRGQGYAGYELWLPSEQLDQPIDLILCGRDLLYEGKVVEEETGEPLADVQVTEAHGFVTFTDDFGNFDLPTFTSSGNWIPFWLEKEGFLIQGLMRPDHPPERDVITMKRNDQVAFRVIALNIDEAQINAIFLQSRPLLSQIQLHCKVKRIGQDEYLVSSEGLNVSVGALCILEAKGFARVDFVPGRWSGEQEDISALEVITLEPERIIEFQVTDHDTGMPIEAARIMRQGRTGFGARECFEQGHIGSLFSEDRYDGRTDRLGQAAMYGVIQSSTCFALAKHGYQPVHVVAAEGVEQISVLLRPEVPSASFLVGNVRGLEPERLSSAFVMALDEQGRRFFGGVDHNGVAKIPAASGGPFRVFLQYLDPQGVQRAPRTPDWIAWNDMPFEFVVESRTDGSR